MVDLSKRRKRKPSTMGSPMRQTCNDEHSRNRRVMTHLKDSLISQLTKLDPSLSLNPRYASLIKRRLKRLFPSLHTPTHPPYALCAIIELKESTGSTEMAISDFISREYDDLPWAHAKILNLQLDKLCEIGEIARAQGGRYVLKVDDEVETEHCEGSSKRKKKGKPRSKRRGMKSVEEEFEEGRIQVFVKQNQLGEAEALGKAQSQDSMLHLETTCFSQATALTCIPAAGTGLSPAQLQLQIPCYGPSESGLDAAAKMSASLTLNVQGCKQEDPVTGHVDHEQRGRKPGKCKQIADHPGDSLLPSASGDATVIEQELNLKKLDERCVSQPQRGQKLRRNAHRINKTHPQDQAEDLACSSHPNQKETSSSQSAATNSPASLTHNSGQQLVVPTSEGSQKCMASRGIKLAPTDFQQQNSSDIDLVILSKRKASLTCENVHDDNQASLEEDPMSRDSDQKPPKRPRGRPPKLETGANCPGESLLPVDDDIHNEQSPNIKKMQQGHQYGRGRGWGRPGRVRGVRLGLGRGQGRPPKLNQIAQQCEVHLQEDQDKQHGGGSGRGTGRGRGRPPKLHGSPIQYDDQSQQEDQAQQHGLGRGRGRPHKLIQSTNQCETQLPQEVQPKPQHVRGRGRGRPPKLNQNTNHCEEHSPDLELTPSSGRGDNQILEQKQLHVQSRERHHKLEFGEAKPPASLRLGSESRCGSGDVSQSNVDANQNRWRLQPVPGRDGCRSLKQNQK